MLIGGLDRALAKSLGKQATAWGQPYTANQAALACAPTSLQVEPASYMPQPTRFADLALLAALEEYGLSPPQIGQLRRAQGVKHLAPFAGLFGLSALVELLRRLHYTPAEVIDPPKDLDSTASKAALGSAPGPALLAARLLLCLPGYFRELARRAPGEAEAHTIESMGWVLAEWLRDQIASQTGYSWWIPTVPAFTNASRYILIAEMGSVLLSFRVQAHTLFDKPDYAKAYEQAFRRWRDGPAGKTWRLETGVDKAQSGAGPGLPFYPDVVTNGIPPHVDIARDRQQMQNIWSRALNYATHNIAGASDQIKWLTTTNNKNNYLAGCGVSFANVSLGGLELAFSYPILTQHKSDVFTGRRARVLSSLAPVFERAFDSIYELGWNDLLIQLQGTFSFRGIRSDPKTPPAEQLRRAQTLSNHGWGAAIDINHFENPLGSKTRRIDPRLVSLLQAFGLAYLGCQTHPDPHHFEYR